MGASGAIDEDEEGMGEGAEGGGGTNLVAATLAAKVDRSSVGRAAKSEDDVFCLDRAILKFCTGGS